MSHTNPPFGKVEQQEEEDDGLMMMMMMMTMHTNSSSTTKSAAHARMVRMVRFVLPLCLVAAMAVSSAYYYLLLPASILGDAELALNEDGAGMDGSGDGTSTDNNMNAISGILDTGGAGRGEDTSTSASTSTNTTTAYDGSSNNPFVHLRRQYVDHNATWYTQIDPSKPNLILHVGPSKTATTTLQEDLADLDERRILERDNYVYLGRARTRYADDYQINGVVMNRKCLRILRDSVYVHYQPSQQQQQQQHQGGGPMDTTMAKIRHAKYNMIDCWKPVLNELRYWKAHNKSIILSSEYMSNDESVDFSESLFATLMDALTAAVEAAGYNAPLVVIGFRRYAEWSLSAVKQHNRLGCATRWKKDAWEEGPCPSAWSLVQEWMHRTPTPSASHYHYTDDILRLWQHPPSNYSTAILNVHEPGHITQKLVCGLLPDAAYTCRHTLMRTPPPRKNSLQQVQSGLATVAYAGYAAGLFDDNVKHGRGGVQKYMDQYMAAAFDPAAGQAPYSYADLPLKNCTDAAAVEEFLNISLRLEEQLVPDFFASSQGESVARQAFWRAHDEKKLFCEVDAQAAIAGKTTWAEVLQGLVITANQKRAAIAATAANNDDDHDASDSDLAGNHRYA